MPRYIDHILGHSSKTGRMYFRDSSGTALLSSLDCKHFELTPETDITCTDAWCGNDATRVSNLAKNVPGKSQLNVPDDLMSSTIQGKYSTSIGRSECILSFRYRSMHMMIWIFLHLLNRDIWWNMWYSFRHGWCVLVGKVATLLWMISTLR